MTSEQWEDLQDFAAENKHWAFIGACGLVIAGNVVLGGGDALKASMAKSATDAELANAQARAEQLYKEQGCVAQAISARSGVSNFLVGDIVIDPKSITPENPGGTPIAQGLICSTDGTLYRVEAGRAVEAIGNSPTLRALLVKKGFASEAQKMRGSL